ncbi:Membrane metallo-endopeptidase-like 1 [Leucoagaricus sp. SymC.cos]|nr:Membrane metallo-endopeptidase-like 1 [Leucoagaricus sp. SymC.cos]
MTYSGKPPIPSNLSSTDKPSLIQGLCIRIPFTRILSLCVVGLSFVNSASAQAPVPRAAPGQSKDVCMDPSCIILAADTLSSLDTTQDPCDNFYDFATNGWSKDHPPPADKGSWGTLQVLDQQNKHVLQRIFDRCRMERQIVMHCAMLELSPSCCSMRLIPTFALRSPGL